MSGSKVVRRKLRLELEPPITYLITSGATTTQTTASSEEFLSILTVIQSAVDAGITLIQLREKQLSARLLFELTERAAELTRTSATRLLVNDRSDIARAAGADGVHLTAHSLEPTVIREAFGDSLLIGSSTHSLAEACAAHQADADFIVFGPVFETRSKKNYGAPTGLKKLGEVVRAVSPLKVLALGGVTTDNAVECMRVGACGVAGISLFDDADKLSSVITQLRGQ